MWQKPVLSSLSLSAFSKMDNLVRVIQCAGVTGQDRRCVAIAEFSPSIIRKPWLLWPSAPSHLSHKRVPSRHQIKQCLEGEAVTHFSPSSDLPGHAPCMNLYTRMEGGKWVSNCKAVILFWPSSFNPTLTVKWRRPSYFSIENKESLELCFRGRTLA